MSKKKTAVQTITVRALGNFIDGNLAGYFEREKQPLYWPAQQERTISVDLYNLCLASGGRFEVIHAKESQDV